MFKKLKEGMIFGLGVVIVLGFFAVIKVLAWQDLLGNPDVNGIVAESGDTLSAAKWNSLVSSTTATWEEVPTTNPDNFDINCERRFQGASNGLWYPYNVQTDKAIFEMGSLTVYRYIRSDTKSLMYQYNNGTPQASSSSIVKIWKKCSN